MREWNALRSYPQSISRIVGNRGIHERIVASYRGREFFDGERKYGYGGLKYDGRWKPVAEDMVDDYYLRAGGSVLQIGCEKGFLLKEFINLYSPSTETGPIINAVGVESSSYARRNAAKGVEILSSFPKMENPFDLVICLGVVYTLNLGGAIDLLRRIEEVGFNSFVTLAAYENEDDLRLFKKWSLLGTTFLRKDEWLEVLSHANYTGDYWFVTAKSLGLREA